MNDVKEKNINNEDKYRNILVQYFLNLRNIFLLNCETIVNAPSILIDFIKLNLQVFYLNNKKAQYNYIICQIPDIKMIENEENNPFFINDHIFKNLNLLRSYINLERSEKYCKILAQYYLRKSMYKLSEKFFLDAYNLNKNDEYYFYWFACCIDFNASMLHVPSFAITIYLYKNLQYNYAIWHLESLIKNGIKDKFIFHKLTLLYYKLGKIRLAEKYYKKTKEDGKFNINKIPNIIDFYNEQSRDASRIFFSKNNYSLQDYEKIFDNNKSYCLNLNLLYVILINSIKENDALRIDKYFPLLLESTNPATDDLLNLSSLLHLLQKSEKDDFVEKYINEILKLLIERFSILYTEYIICKNENLEDIYIEYEKYIIKWLFEFIRRVETCDTVLNYLRNNSKIQLLISVLRKMEDRCND